MTRYKRVYKESDEKELWFIKRTNYHISLVQKYLDKIINSEISNNLDKNILIQQKEIHDQTKFINPEREPYIDLTWDYKLKDMGQKVNLTDEQKKFQNTATNHHIKNNSHHPEYWDKNFISVPLNDRDSKTIGKPTNATKMPLEYIACMVADWMAMSEEKENSPYDWANTTINKRWLFTPIQEKFIYSVLDSIWGK